MKQVYEFAENDIIAAIKSVVQRRTERQPGQPSPALDVLLRVANVGPNKYEVTARVVVDE